jgi:hypothetical protein
MIAPTGSALPDTPTAIHAITQADQLGDRGQASIIPQSNSTFGYLVF